MDKYEYKVKAEEINERIKAGDFAQAAELADTIDWRRVKSVSMLCTISDVYKMNRRFEDAKELLEMAYDRHPGSRTICYSLCELTIKTQDYVQAFEYYKQFVQIAPKDPGKYVLKYKIYTAQDVSIEERIEVLKELKAHNEYHEKWLYELAYLYHRMGLVSQCVDECDELITMFGSGKYVIKAMELKKLHQPLTPEQQKKYVEFAAELAKEDQSGQPFVEPNFDDTKIYKKGSFNETDNVGQGRDEILEDELKREDEEISLGETKVLENVQKYLPRAEKEEDEEEPEINVKVMDPGYNTINLQETVAEGLRQILKDDRHEQVYALDDADGDTESLDFSEITEVSEEDLENESGRDVIERTEVFFGDTAEIPESAVTAIMQEESLAAPEQTEAVEPDSGENDQAEYDQTAQVVMEQLRLENVSDAARKVMEAQPPKEMAEVLTQGYDGQISFIVPETQSIEKQITGQLNLDDILLEWERMKKENAEKNEEAVARHVKEQTGEMFTEFEASLRDSLLEKLEKGEEEYADPVSDEDEVEELAEIADEPETAEDFQTPVNSDIENDGPADEAPGEESAEPEMNSEMTPDAARQEERSEQPSVEAVGDKPALRKLTREEKALFGDYIQSKSAKEQLINILDNTTMAAYTGNIIVTGDEGTGTLNLCKNIVKQIKLADSNLSGRVAKISGKTLNEKDIPKLIGQVANGALIIEKASGISDEKAGILYQELQNESLGVVVILEDSMKAMDRFLARNDKFATCFTNRMDVQALNNDTLVAYGKQYAYKMEYSIDELGILAFHTRIEERQTLEHAVTVGEVKEIVDKAIRHANKKTLGHFFDILLAKRYDEEDMIVLGEKDFI